MRDPRQIRRLEDIPMTVEAAIDGPPMRVGEILSLEPGSVVTAPGRAGENVKIFAGGALVAAGELSNAGGRPSVRLVKVGSHF